MTCPGCKDAELDGTFFCDRCGYKLRSDRWVALKAEWPAPRTRELEEDRMDYAIREAG